MLKKRLIGVITTRDGWAVQSIGYRRYLPLGRPEWLAQNLDRWSVDEILVLSIDRTRKGLGPDLELLRRLGALGLATPLAYGGGISTTEHARAVVQSGADRLCVDALLRTNPAAVKEISRLVGAQAVIGALPLALQGNVLTWRDYLSARDTPLRAADLTLFQERVVSEALGPSKGSKALPAPAPSGPPEPAASEGGPDTQDGSRATVPLLAARCGWITRHTPLYHVKGPYR